MTGPDTAAVLVFKLPLPSFFCIGSPISCTPMRAACSFLHAPCLSEHAGTHRFRPKTAILTRERGFGSDSGAELHGHRGSNAYETPPYSPGIAPLLPPDLPT